MSVIKQKQTPDKRFLFPSIKIQQKHKRTQQQKVN